MKTSCIYTGKEYDRVQMPHQSKQRVGPKRKIALIYNAFEDTTSETRTDHGDMWHLHQSVRGIARALRKLDHKVWVVPLADDLAAFQRRLLRLAPDVVFNQYDDVVHGALYEMRVATLVRMMGFPLTGSPALGLGLSRYKYMCSTLLQGAGLPIPSSRLLERIGEVDRHDWQFPVIVQASQEHAGVGLDRDSVVMTKAALRQKVRTIITTYRQPALVQRFLLGREFNVGIIGGKKPRVLPLAEVDYSRLPTEIPPIMSYAAKFLETTTEYRSIRVSCPADVPAELAARISDTAKRAFRAVGGWGYGRVDIRLDENDLPHVLEVNCNPLLEDGVGLARSARVAGLGFPQLLGQIVNTAFEDPPFDPNLPIRFPSGRGKSKGPAA
jgi:D-alanine-D-alanine ligase